MSYELRDGNEITEFETVALAKGAANKRWPGCELADYGSGIAVKVEGAAVAVIVHVDGTGGVVHGLTTPRV